MARHRWTFAVILICLPLLATVITAFRVRDLPKTLQDSLKPELKGHKCEDCDANEDKVGQKLHSVKIESVKRPYEDLKKNVKKKPTISQKVTETKPTYKFVDVSGDEDDDDDLDILKSGSGFKREEHLKTIKTVKGSDDKKTGAATKKPISLDSDDDEEEDDEISPKSKKTVGVKTKSDATKIKVPETKLKKPLIIQDVKTNDNDDDEDDDDDDNDHVEIKKKSTIIEKKNKVEPGAKSKSDNVKPTIKKVEQRQSDDDDNDEDDDDDDDDDDDEDDGGGIFSGLLKQAKNILTSDKSPSEKSPKKDQKDSKKDHSAKPSDKIDDKLKDKNKEPIQKGGTRQVIVDKKVTEPVKKESKPVASDTVKKPSDTDKGKPAEPKKEVKNELKNTKTKDDLPTKETVQKRKELEKEVIKPKVQEKESVKPKITEKEVKSKPDDIKKVDKKAEPKEKVEKPIVAEPKKSESPKKQFEKDVGKKDKSSIESLVDSQEFNAKVGSNLKDVNDALYRRNMLQSEFEDFYAFFPTFAPNFSRIHNPECRRHGQILLRQLRGTKLWALNMLDATAKIPSGLLQGNGIQLGDFDQCLESRARVQLDTGSVVKVQGKYCLARLDLKAEHPELEGPVYLAQAKNLIKSRIDDPGHFVPRFSTLSWGVCVPTACEPADVEVVIKDAVKHYQHKTGLVIRVKVDDQDCQTLENDWWDDWSELPTILTLSFYAVVILLVFVATIQDFMGRSKSEGGDEGGEKAECDQKETNDEEEKNNTGKPSEGLLSSFSLYYTINKLTAPGTTDEISCIHGIRGLATIALLVAHKFLPVAVMPYTNRLKITETVSSPLWSWCRAGWMYTDCFLLLSGALTAHSMSKSDSGAPRRLLSRYLRLTPALLAVVLFYAYVWDNLSTGPMWGSLVTKNAEICQEGWWWNLLYVQNYFGFEEMCAPQTHQLALDMQLTILGGAIVWALQTDIAYTRFLVPILHILAAYSRYTTVRDHRLTLLAYHGVTVSQLYRTARLSYTSILHRSTPYLVGLNLGLALQQPTEHSKIVRIIGWFTSATFWGLVLWAGQDSGATTYRYSTSFAAQYSALAPIASALAIAWVIYAVHTGSTGLLSRFLCCRPLVFISRLSYALYLCQFVVFLTNAATVRTSSEFSLTSMIDVQEISAILLSSIVLTLTFVIPMQSLHKAFKFSPKIEKDEQENETETQSKEEKIEPEEKSENIIVEEVEEVIEVQQIKSRPHLLAHREVLEEIPEVEVEYEVQRDKDDGLEEILEEEEDEVGEEEMENHLDEDDLEIIEEEGGEDDFWTDREEYAPRRSYSRNEAQDADEWEWTANGSGRNGAQYYRYSR